MSIRLPPDASKATTYQSRRFGPERRGPYTAAVAGTLYVVATPIGNLEDLTARAARVLADVALVAAENRQTAAKLLRHLAISTPCVTYNDRNKARSTPRLLAELKADSSIALISEAGTPGISDPGQDLVAAAIEVGAQVVPIPGASAPATLLSVAGARARTARLVGFLPRRTGERRRLLADVGERGEATLAFESPHRLRESLADIAAVLPRAHLVVGRELTKLYEEVWRGSPEEAQRHFERPRGEFSLLILPAPPEPGRWPDDAVRAALQGKRAAGARRAPAAAAVAAQSGRTRREVYALWPTAEAAQPGGPAVHGQ